MLCRIKTEGLIKLPLNATFILINQEFRVLKVISREAEIGDYGLFDFMETQIFNAITHSFNINILSMIYANRVEQGKILRTGSSDKYCQE